MALPDQRHLRRAADAAAYEDSNKPIMVAVELKNTPPFDAVVFDPPPDDPEGELEQLRERTGRPWAGIPTKTEKSVFRNEGIEDKLYFILHEWWSPLVTHINPRVRRDDIGSVALVVKGRNGEILDEINITKLLADKTNKQPATAKPDAIFFSFEALDKFLFPQLASTYGVKGAWQERNRIRRELGDEVRSDFDEQQEDLAADQPAPPRALAAAE